MISAADLYPEFIGVDPAPKAKALLASDRQTGRAARAAPNPRGAPAQSSTKRPTAGQTAPPVKTSDVVDDSNRWYPGHKGIDLITDGAKPIYACVKAEVIDVRGGGWWGIGNPGGTEGAKGDGIVRIKAVEDVGDVKKGTVFGYGHAESASVKVGDVVEAGTYLGKTGFANAWHTHWFVGAPDSDARDGDQDPLPYWQAFKKGTAQLTGVTSPTGDSGGGGGDGVDARSMKTIGTAAAFAVTMEGTTDDQRKEALLLTDQKSYMNDKPLIDFIDQLCTASMHHFQSLPDGRFYAFFPDYFGSFNHRAPYWEIDDVEITNMSIYLSDTDLATHVYVVGETLLSTTITTGGMSNPDYLNKINSSGVVTIFDVFNLNWLDNVSDKSAPSVFADAGKFLQRYGVRPHYEAAPYIHAPFFELFMGFQRFMFLWSRQFLTHCEFTFMPELYPGGRVSFKDRNLICYVDSVTHRFDYEEGFTTTAELSAPSSDVNSRGYPLGMVRPSTGGSK